MKSREFTDFKYDFGDRVKDLISGINGTITAKLLFDSGLKKYQIDDGTIFGKHWILEDDLKFLKLLRKNKIEKGNKKHEKHNDR